MVIKDPGRHETLETTLKVAAGDVLENHNYKLQPGGNARLTVKVEDSNGRSVDGIELFDKWGDLLGAVKSGGVFSNLSAGTYTLRASGGKNHEDLEVSVSIKKGEKLTRSYTLMPSAKVFDVDFWVVGEKNKSLAGVRIIVESGGKQVAQRVTDSKGKALVRLPAGAIQLGFTPTATCCTPGIQGCQQGHRYSGDSPGEMVKRRQGTVPAFIFPVIFPCHGRKNYPGGRKKQ